MNQKTRKRSNPQFWTRERVDNGLARFIRDFFDGREAELPTNQYKYAALIPVTDRRLRESERLYPPPDAVMRFYESFVAAWWEQGILVEVRSSKAKWIITPEIDDKLREIYAATFGAKSRPADLFGVKPYARSIGYPDFVLTKRAQQLGLSRVKESPWTDGELALLDKFGYYTPIHLVRLFKQHGFKRTETAILLMRRRRLVHKASPYYSLTALSRLFGIDQHGVKAWIDKGWLQFIFKETARSSETKQRGDVRLVHRDWIYDFIVAHPTAFEIKKVDQLWFLHIVTKSAVALSFSDDARGGERSDVQRVEAPREHRKPRGIAANEARIKNSNAKQAKGAPQI